MTSVMHRVPPSLSALRHALAEQRRVLSAHSVFGTIKDANALRTFMEWHVFAVWDFMSLIKRLQQDLTNVRVPWTPSPYPEAARLINEIVLGEETDTALAGGHISHYGLYLGAMREVGASTARIEAVVARVRGGARVDDALLAENVEPAIRAFVEQTMRVAAEASLFEVLGNFYYGREEIVPTMFSALLAQWGIERHSVPLFTYYLERHIELDGTAHGPKTQAIIDEIVGTDETALEQLLNAALAAISQRIRLWDALEERLYESDHRRIRF